MKAGGAETVDALEQSSGVVVNFGIVCYKASPS